MKQFALRCLFTLVLLPCISVWPAYGETLENLKQQCATCHGADGNSSNPFAPSIAGISARYFDWTMDAYINGRRKDLMMNNFAHQLTNEHIKQLGDYYSKQVFKPLSQDFKPELAKQGKQLHNQYCEKCHENGGRAGNQTPGILRGQWSDYLRKVLKEYLNKERKGNSMMLKKLNKLKANEGLEAVEKLINFYASDKQAG